MEADRIVVGLTFKTIPCFIARTIDNFILYFYQSQNYLVTLVLNRGITLAIEWDVIVVEMTLLAAIIYGAIYIESWVEKRKVRSKEQEMKKKNTNHRCQRLEQTIAIYR